MEALSLTRCCNAGACGRIREEFETYGCAGAYSLPRNPDEVWKDSWEGWDDFLGVMRSFQDARDKSRKLGLKSEEEWQALVEKVPSPTFPTQSSPFASLDSSF